MASRMSPPQRAAAWLLGTGAAAVAILQLTRLIAAPEPPVGEAIAPFATAAGRVIPPTEGYLYVQPVAFGQDTGDDPRLRYDLYPRLSENLRVAEGAAAAYELVRRDRLGYIVLASLDRYPPDAWVRDDLPWFRRGPSLPGGAILVVPNNQ